MATFELYISGDDTHTDLQSGTSWKAQTFTPSIAHSITSVKLKLFRVGSPGTITVSIRATDGSGHPTGDDLTSGTTDGDTLTTNNAGEWREVTLTSYTLSAGTKYAIVIRALSADASNYFACREHINSPTYTGGNREYSTDSGSSWSATTGADMMFRDRGPAVPSASVSVGFAQTSANNSRALVATRSSSASMSLIASPRLELDMVTWLCVASQDSGSIKSKSALGSAWTDCAKDAGGGLVGSHFAQYLNRLCVINFEKSGFSYSSVNDITANWTEKSAFPNLPHNFTDLFVGRDAGDDPALYFLTPTGMFYLDVFANFVFGPTELSWEYDSTSGKKGMYWKGSHYIAVGKGIYCITKGVVDLVGPDVDDGLPSDIQGSITDMIGVGFWLVIAVDGGTSKKSSILKRYITGNHWHPVHVTSAVNTPIRALFWDSGTLYFGEGTNVKSLPFPAITDNVREISTHTYAASGELIDSYFHSEFEAMPKVAHKVWAVTQDCDSDDKITISYRIDEETAWTELGSFETSPRPTALPFPASGDSIGVSFERIQFKRAFERGSTTTNSPKLVSLILEYRVVPPVLWGFDVRVLARTQGDQSGKSIISALKTALETATLLSFYPSGDKSDTEYFVEVKGMPGNEAGTEFGTEGIYQLSVEQVVD